MDRLKKNSPQASRPFKLSGRTATRIAKAFLPSVILTMVRRRLVTKEHLQNPTELLTAVRKHLKIATKNLEYCVSIEGEFLKESIRHWKQGDQYIAIVLYATAAEQTLNSTYQLILTSQGWTTGQVAKLLREVSVDAKIDWMFEVFAKGRFPGPLKSRLRTLFSVRNAIVHYKSEIGHIELENDGNSKLELQMKGLKRLSISRDFRLLNEVLNAAVFRVDEDHELAVNAVQMIFDQQKLSEKETAN